MIKTIGLILTLLGAVALILGVLAIFETLNLGKGTWPCIILGVLFFFAGIGLLKGRKDPA